MLDQLTSLLSLNKNDAKKIDQIFEELEERYADYHDPWGLDLKTCKDALKLFLPFYKYYFKVRVFGAKRVEDRPFMVVSNHTGQLPIDGMLITICFLWDIAPARILRGMIERFMVQLPFLGELTAQTGSILGDRKNCQYLIDHGETILVFPEGVRGVSKNTSDFYKLQGFTTGFFRLALQNDLDIIPVATVGAEEMYPFVYHSKKLAKFFKLPAMPITPLFPMAGPIGVIPLPSPIDIYIGKPYRIAGKVAKDASDKEINEHILNIEDRIKTMINRGLVKRRPFFDSIRIPVFKYLREKNKVDDDNE